MNGKNKFIARVVVIIVIASMVVTTVIWALQTWV